MTPLLLHSFPTTENKKLTFCKWKDLLQVFFLLVSVVLAVAFSGVNLNSKLPGKGASLWPTTACNHQTPTAAAIPPAYKLQDIYSK